MSYALGIDIGSASLAAAVNDGVSPSRMLELGAGSASCPSAVYLGHDGMVVGEQALMLGGEHPELLVRGYLSRVGDDVPIVAGDYAVAAEDLVALVARWVVDRAEELEAAPPAAVMVTYPTTWGAYRTAVLENALAGVGLGLARLVPAAVAAVADHDDGEGAVVAVYDLGEEFELALLERGPDGGLVPREGGCAESAEGGGCFDDAVFAHVSSTLQLDTGVAVLSQVRQECVGAKEALSFDSEVTIPVEVGDRPTLVRMVRSEFEVLIDEVVHDTIDTAHRAIRCARLEDDDLTAIVLVGGSSRVPLVAELLSAEFRRPILIGADPGETVALGAASLGAVDLPETVIALPAVPAGLRRPTYALALAAAAAAAIVVSVTATQAAESPRAVTPPSIDARGLFWPDDRTTSAVEPDAGSKPPADDPAPSDDTDYTAHGAPAEPRDAATAPVGTHTGQTPSSPAADPQPEPEPDPTTPAEPDPEPTTPADPEPEPDPTPEPEPEPTPEPEPEPAPTSDPLPEPAEATGLELAVG